MPRSPDARWPRIGTLILAVVGALTLAACGATQSGQKSTSATSTATLPPTTATTAATTTTQAPTTARALPGYLATPTNQVVFLEFTPAGGQISGTVQFAYLSSDGTQVETANGPIDGKISGSSVTINDENEVITSSGSVSGTFEGSDLVLAFPQQNGELAPVQFSPASVAAYNNAVETLQVEANQAATAQQAAAAAQQAAADAAAAQAKRQQAIAFAVQSVNTDQGNILNDISALANDEQTLTSDVSTVQGDLRTVKGDLIQTERDAKSDPTSVCDDAGGVQDDQGGMVDDQGGYEDDLSSDQSDTSSVQQDMASLRSDWVSLASAESADPTYVPTGGLPPFSSETSDLSAGNSALSKYQQSVTTDTRTIAGYLSQANTYVAQANRLCSSSGG